MAEGFRIATAFVQVSPDTEGFKEELKTKLDEATGGVEGKVKVTLDTSELDAKVDEARAKIDELSSRMAEPSVRLDDADLSAKADDAKAKLDELDAKSARPDVGLTASDLDARVDEARAKLDELDSQRAEPRLNLDDAEFNAKVDRAEARLDSLNAKSASPRLGASGGESLGGGGGGGEGGGLLGAITMGLGALMPGVGGAVTGLGLLGGVGAMALGPVAKALSEAHQANMNVGLTPQQLASTEFSNSVAIQQAQQAVAMAHEQAAQDAVTSAQSIASAQMNLASVERNTAESQIQALHSVEQAQQGLEQANYGLSQAQYNLNQAWERAREEIVQLNDQLADSKLNVQSAQLAIQQALYQQKLTDQNAYSTQLDREQAALAVVRAQQQLKDASDQETASQYAANLANRQGIEHSQTMIQAKQGVTQAQYAQTNAQFAAADAQRQLTLTELNNAQQIKAAQMQLAATEEQAAYQRMRDAEQVSIAQRNVSNTLQEQQLQWAAMMSTENQAANQFAKDMSRLSPAGRDFVNQVLAMSGAFRDLEFAAQSAVLPGFTAFLQGLQVLMPTIESGVTRMGTAIADAFSALGEVMATPQFATMLDGLITNGIRFADIVIPAFAQFAGELGMIGSQQGAVDGLANLLAGIAHALTGMAAGIGDSMPAINQFLTAAGNLIAQIGPALAQIISLVAKTLEPLTSYLNAHPNGTIVVLLGQIVAAMMLFKPLVGVVSAPFRALSVAVESISGLPAKLKAIVEKIVAAWGGLGGLNSTSTAASGAIGAGTAAATVPAVTFMRNPPIANRGVLGPMSAIGGPTAFAEMLGPLGFAAAAAAIGLGITYFADRVRQASDQAAGVIEHSSGELTAATSVSGQHVSDSYRTLANNIADSAQSSGVTVQRGGDYAAARFGDYTQNWSKHNDALVNVMYLGKTQLGQAVGEFVSSTGGNVDRMGQSLRQQGKTINQAYNDAMNQAFLDLGGKTRASWAQAEQTMTQGLDKYYATMRQTTQNDWNNLQQVTTQLVTDGYNHRTDLEKQDNQKFLTLVQQFMSDRNNHLIDTSKQNISQLSQDIQKYWSDLTGATQGSTAADILQLQNDLNKHFNEMTDSVDSNTSRRLDAEIAKAQSDIARIQQSIPLPFTQHADGGYIAGPGGPRDDRVPAMLSNGEFVINAKSTSAFRPLLEAINSPRFADGGFVNPAGPRLVNEQRAFAEQASLQQMQGLLSGAGDSAGAGVQRWSNVVLQALKLAGQPASLLGITLQRMNQESGGNPTIVNTWDSNWLAGTPSVGLMQVIGPTYRSFAGPFRNTGPFEYGVSVDPLANLYASMEYALSTYGSLAAAYGRAGGYDSGGWLMPGDIPINGLRKPEAVLTPEESQAFVQIVRQLTAQQGGAPGVGGGPTIVQNYNGTQWPTAEQKASMLRDLGLAIGGATG